MSPTQGLARVLLRSECARLCPLLCETVTFSAVWLETGNSGIERWAINGEVLIIGASVRKEMVLTKAQVMDGKTNHGRCDEANEKRKECWAGRIREWVLVFQFSEMSNSR